MGRVSKLIHVIVPVRIDVLGLVMDILDHIFESTLTAIMDNP